MDSDQTMNGENNNYRNQFEKYMVAITAKQAKAQIEIAEIRAIQKETEALMKENAAQQRKTDQQLYKTQKQLKKAHKEFFGKWGRLVESLVDGQLVELLRGRNIKVNNIHSRQQVYYIQGNGMRKDKEFDIVVVNSTEAVVVEVKTTLNPDDVKRFIGAMREFSRCFPYWESKRVYGAVAYIHCDSAADVYAESRGLFVIRATGSSASIMNAEDFEPKPFTKVSPPRGHLRAVPSG